MAKCAVCEKGAHFGNAVDLFHSPYFIKPVLRMTSMPPEFVKVKV